MSAPNSRTVHPCVLSVFEGKTGVEYSTWAHVTQQSLELPNDDDSKIMPDLVTANGSSLSIYRVHEATGKMLLVHTFSNLAGSICFLETLRVNDDSRGRFRRPDALLVGFCGNPRMAIVHVKPDLLLATTLLDLTQAVTENSYGAVTPLEQDLKASLFQQGGEATVSIVLGGGIAIVCLDLHCKEGRWKAVEEPYVLPLSTLARAIDGINESSHGKNHSNMYKQKTDTSNNPLLNQSIVTGFGDILSTAFLPGYLEPTMVILHANPYVGLAWSGRLGRDTEGGKGGTRYSLVLTAVTVTVRHQRSALLWSTEVPADAMYVYTFPFVQPGERNPPACLVHCLNSLVWVSSTGQIQQCLAVNGWVSSTLSTVYNSIVKPNHWPFPKLSLQLDGAQFTPINPTTWFVVLRRGQVYLLQQERDTTEGQWSLVSLYQTIGAVGEVSKIICCPMGIYSGASLGNTKDMLYTPKKTFNGEKHEIGLLFVASRLGDSSLIAYALGKTSVAEAIKTEPGLGGNLKIENSFVPVKGEGSSSVPKPENATGDETYERILQLEEDALYGEPTHDEQNTPDVIPPSDDEGSTQRLQEQESRRKRTRFGNLLVVRSLHVLDSLTALGPLGPACMGPLTPSPVVPIDPTISSSNTTSPMPSTGQVFPCGYGSSGGIALMSVPGRDDRNILAEADCINGKALFCLSRRALVLMAMFPEDGGTKVFRFEKPTPLTVSPAKKNDLVEVDLKEWCPNEDTRDFFTNCHLLLAKDLTDNSFLVLAASPIDATSMSYFLIVLKEEANTIRMMAANQIDVPEGGFITTAKAVEDEQSDQVFLAYALTTGETVIAVIASDGSFTVKHTFSAEEESSMDTSEEELSEEEKFYSQRKVVSLDIFEAPKSFFFSESTDDSDAMEDGDTIEESSSEPRSLDYHLDEDDIELYYESRPKDHVTDPPAKQAGEKRTERMDTPASNRETTWYCGVSRQSGELEMFFLSDLTTPLWSSKGCGHGTPSLESADNASFRNPNGHKVCAREMKFFFCGPTSEEYLAGPRPFCMMLETNDGDIHIYDANINSKSMRLRSFSRVPMNDVARQSQEATKHFSKLRRKKIISAKDGNESSFDFQYNRLLPFRNISGQDGVFACVSRPFWVIAERGRPTILHHRSRHAAPAGAKPRPIAGFCSGLSFSNTEESRYVTVHERVGRVGSQRMTLFDGILGLTSKNSLLPGGGLFLEKIPFGVTVRKIQFIDDGHPSTGSHPLYAVLVSREYEADMSELNDDGLTEEERQQLALEKENAKIQRQVEADLGGFDIEQEWVEEIERENCFKVNRDLGGAPPQSNSAYSLWIVDAANGWQVVDSYELLEFEHGTSMDVMNLTEFTAEPGTEKDISEEELGSKLFIAVGAGTIDIDGEDVASKGRVMLFEVNRPKDLGTLPAAELNLVYEKKIFHGPVTSLSCLEVEGKSRLIIGAGSDINVEQWGNEKLTQVGFFRATMQVLDIKHFKNFFILSDAYDSLYFLVWRESDKSLTMLAKDYDPIPVYCSGILSRGGSLSFVCHDDRQNLQFFQYAPGDPAARGGNKLVCRADYHLGSQTTNLRSHFCRSSLLINSATPSSSFAALKQQDTFFGKGEDDQRLALTFGTTDGGYGAVVPVSEPVYWRMTALQSVLANALESDCALSHRAWRLYRRASRRGGCRSNERKKGVIDGDLVMQYTDLSKADQEDLASAIGSTVDLILDNLLELRCSAMVL